MLPAVGMRVIAFDSEFLLRLCGTVGALVLAVYVFFLSARRPKHDAKTHWHCACRFTDNFFLREVQQHVSFDGDRDALFEHLAAQCPGDTARTARAVAEAAAQRAERLGDAERMAARAAVFRRRYARVTRSLWEPWP